MSNRDMMFAAWLLIGGLVISQIMSMAYFGGADTSVTNSLLILRTYNLFGIIPIPFLNIDFFVVGLKSLIQWDFAFFQGIGFDMIKYLFYVISVGLVWGIAVSFAGFQFWRAGAI